MMVKIEIATTEIFFTEQLSSEQGVQNFRAFRRQFSGFAANSVRRASYVVRLTGVLVRRTKQKARSSGKTIATL